MSSSSTSSPSSRSEEHTSELQSLRHLVCRLLLEKKRETTGAWQRIPMPPAVAVGSCFTVSRWVLETSPPPGVVAPSSVVREVFCLLFFFNDPAPTEIYTLSLPDPLPISNFGRTVHQLVVATSHADRLLHFAGGSRSEEHTSELQSLRHLVCRLLLEK